MNVVDIAPLRTAVPIRDDDDSLAAASIDFGRMVHRAPRAVVTPRSTEDVRRIMEFAGRAGCPVAIRGAGHSQNGQSLTDGGIVLDMTGLDRIEEEVRNGAIRVQAGTTWRKLVRHVQAQGYLPRILTTYPDVTVGGTLSTGGFGPSSHRYGAQVDNVEELVVVTGDAEERRCSRTENPELFDCVRGGLGQFAVITEARIRLRRVLPRQRTFVLACDDIEALMQDQRHAIASGRFEDIDATCLGASAMLRAAGFQGVRARRSPYAKRRYVMRLTVEFDRDVDVDGALAGLHGRLLDVEDRLVRDMYAAGTAMDGNKAARSSEDRSLAHPWMEVILPWRLAGRCIEETLTGLPPALPLDTTVLLWATPRHRFGAPMLALPAGEMLMAFSILPDVKPAALARLRPDLEAAAGRMTATGGKRYVSGWVEHDQAQWRTHFGALWPQILKWKASFDPSGILNPDFIHYGPPPPA